MSRSTAVITVVTVSLAGAAALGGAAVLRAEHAAAPVAPPDAYVFQDIMEATSSFLGSLQPGQRAKAIFSFDDAERLNWHYVPRARRGVALREMSASQQQLARGILQAGLSKRGYLTASTIIELELVLRELGEDPRVRDPELYFISVFGIPSRDAPWGVRVEGHHLSLNFTIVSDTLIATAPAFFGANPARVQSGSQRGVRALADEEDIGRQLVLSLDEQQQDRAMIAVRAPSDVVTGNAARVQPLTPIGIPVTELRPGQAATLLRLIDVYLGRMAEPLVTHRRSALERTDFSKVTFAWAGSTRPGEPHYYRIQGPSFLIEYDNTQGGANHVHTVWRDFDGDFGRDLLRDHYRKTSHPD